MAIGRSMVHLHVDGRNLHDASGAYQCFQDFASSIKSGQEPETVQIRGDDSRIRPPFVASLPWGYVSVRFGSIATHDLVTNNQGFIPNYGERYRAGERISTGFVESTVN